MGSAPLVSAITPCYNGENYLAVYLTSMLQQTYPNIQLVIVDDGSTDRTYEVAKSFEIPMRNRGVDYHIICNEHGGQARAINSGLQLVTGKYLIWPDSDDVLEKTSIEKRVELLESNPQYGFVRSNGAFFDFETGKDLARLSNSEDCKRDDIFMDLILEKTYCACGCYMVRMEVLKSIYPNMHIMESEAGQNWQLLIPIAGKTKCGYIDEDLYRIAVREGSHSRRKRNLEDEIIRYNRLKEVLEEGIRLAERSDADYKRIVDCKYDRILFGLFIRYKEFERAKAQYNLLKEKKECSNEERSLYIKTFHPFYYQFRYFVYRILRRFKRYINYGKYQRSN